LCYFEEAKTNDVEIACDNKLMAAERSDVMILAPVIVGLEFLIVGNDCEYIRNSGMSFPIVPSMKSFKYDLEN